MDAREYLAQVGRITAHIDDLDLERSLWRDLASKITPDSGDMIRSSACRSRMADALDTCVDAEADIDKSIEALRSKIEEVRETIHKMENPMESGVLHKRYIMGWDFDKVADYYRKKYSWVTTIHGRALKSLDQLLEQR